MNQQWDKNWIAAKIHDSHIKWIGINSTKPGRNHNFSSLVINSNSKWAKDNLHRDIQEVQDIILKELKTLINLDVKNLSYVSTRRWLYSNVQPFYNSPYYVDLENDLCVFGDWCKRSDIETVWLNAKKATSFVVSRI